MIFPLDTVFRVVVFGAGFTGDSSMNKSIDHVVDVSRVINVELIG